MARGSQAAIFVLVKPGSRYVGTTTIRRDDAQVARGGDDECPALDRGIGGYHLRFDASVVVSGDDSGPGETYADWLIRGKDDALGAGWGGGYCHRLGGRGGQDAARDVGREPPCASTIVQKVLIDESSSHDVTPCWLKTDCPIITPRGGGAQTEKN